MGIVCEHRSGRIRDELPRLLKHLKDPIGLLRGWDSKRDPKGIVGVLNGLDLPAAELPAGALLEPGTLALPSFADCLYGFDELWIGCPDTDWSKLASLPPMTSEQVDFSSDECGLFRRALFESGAVLALADGCGLNTVRRQET